MPIVTCQHPQHQIWKASNVETLEWTHHELCGYKMTVLFHFRNAQTLFFGFHTQSYIATVCYRWNECVYSDIGAPLQVYWKNKTNNKSKTKTEICHNHIPRGEFHLLFYLIFCWKVLKVIFFRSSSNHANMLHEYQKQMTVYTSPKHLTWHKEI